MYFVFFSGDLSFVEYCKKFKFKRDAVKYIKKDIRDMAKDYPDENWKDMYFIAKKIK